MSHSLQNIFDITEQNFKEIVIDGSQNALVILDFWADWCQPCKQLLPTLERVINTHNGLVKLAKVNIEHNQMLAQQMQVQSVPTVIAVYQGRPINGFNGAISHSEIEKFINDCIKTADITDPNKQNIDAPLKAGLEAIKNNDIQTALPLFLEVLDIEPNNTSALIGLAKCYIHMDELDAVETILNDIDDTDNTDVKTIVTALELARKGKKNISDIDKMQHQYSNNPNDLENAFILASTLWANNAYEHSITVLLDIYTKDKTWKNGIVKTELLKYFEILGADNPITIKGRKKLSSLIFI